MPDRTKPLPPIEPRERRRGGRDDRFAGGRAVVASLALLLLLLPIRPSAALAADGEDAAAGDAISLGAGTYDLTGSVFGTATDGLVGRTTAAGHVVRVADRLVGLPACTVSACPWVPPGTGPGAESGPQTDCAEGDGLCWVEITSPQTGACAVAPVLEVGPRFAKDNWWAPREARSYGLEPGVPAAEVAAAGADLGFGPGISDRGDDVADAAAIGVAAGTWADLGLEVTLGIAPLRVRLLWQAQLFHEQACGSDDAASGENATTTDALALRAAPSLDAEVLSTMAAGVRVTIGGPGRDGFYPTTHGGRAGWAAGDFLVFDAGPAGKIAFAVDAVNLRAGPSFADEVLGVLPIGAMVAAGGEAANGFVAVAHQGRPGWVYAAYLDADANPGPDALLTTTALNLRAGPSTADPVRSVLPAGTSVALTGGEANGFRAVRHGEVDGWAAADFLTTDADVSATAVTTDVLNLRAGPSSTAEIVRELPPGLPVTPTGDRVDGFVAVAVEGIMGWVATAYLD